mgnify:CR=1 FL=1
MLLPQIPPMWIQTSETTFAPDALVTRGQFVTILGRMVNAGHLLEGDCTSPLLLPQIPPMWIQRTYHCRPQEPPSVPADAWYRDELAYALHNGYISGTSETTFAPDALIQLLTMTDICSTVILLSGANCLELTPFTMPVDLAHST